MLFSKCYFCVFYCACLIYDLYLPALSLSMDNGHFWNKTAMNLSWSFQIMSINEQSQSWFFTDLWKTVNIHENLAYSNLLFFMKFLFVHRNLGTNKCTWYPIIFYHIHLAFSEQNAILLEIYLIFWILERSGQIL